MRLVWLAALLAVGWVVAARSSVGLRVGNEARALSDRAMLAFLRVTSEFEKEA